MAQSGSVFWNSPSLWVLIIKKNQKKGVKKEIVKKTMIKYLVKKKIRNIDAMDGSYFWCYSEGPMMHSFESRSQCLRMIET
jgi:hypothetical protein